MSAAVKKLLFGSTDAAPSDDSASDYAESDDTPTIKTPTKPAAKVRRPRKIVIMTPAKKITAIVQTAKPRGKFSRARRRRNIARHQRETKQGDTSAARVVVTQRIRAYMSMATPNNWISAAAMLAIKEYLGSEVLELMSTATFLAHKKSLTPSVMADVLTLRDPRARGATYHRLDEIKAHYENA